MLAALTLSSCRFRSDFQPHDGQIGEPFLLFLFLCHTCFLLFYGVRSLESSVGSRKRPVDGLSGSQRY